MVGLNILHIIHKPEMGGVQKFVASLIPSANSSYNKYFLIASISSEGDFIDEFKSSGLRYLRYPGVLRYFRPVRVYRAFIHFHSFYRLVTLILQIIVNKIDVVHTHLYESSEVAIHLSACTFCKIPLVWTLHGLVYEDQNIDNLQKALLAAQNKSISIAITYVGARQKILDILDLPTSIPVVPVPIGIKLDEYHVTEEMRIQNREQYGLDPDDIVVGCTARLSPEKGLDTLIESAGLVSEVVPNMRFFIAGEGRMRHELERIVSEISQPDTVTILGQVQDIRWFLSLLDIYVQPSRGEGIPLGIIEAMAAGLPVVATDVGGISLAVKDQITGFLVPPVDSTALSDAIVSLARDRNKRKLLGTNGITESTRFHIDDVRSYYERLYITLCQNK